MVKAIREEFNKQFTEEKYQNLLQEIEKEFPNQLDFRVAESPVYIDNDFKAKLMIASNDIIDAILKPNFKELTDRAIPDNLNVPNEGKHPHFLAIDFAITKNISGEIEPQLIELQGFPSLFAYQWYLSQKYQKIFYKNAKYSAFFNRLSVASYIDEMKKVLVGRENIENTILLEIYPEKQKTRLDFAITEKLWGIKPVCITKVIQEGRKLFYENEGQKIEIKRIYNRLIFDDLQRNFPDLKLHFDYTKDTDVQWITHPNWFFRISKFTLPLLKSKYVPESWYVSDLKEIPTDLENYVLKPLFSFAGSGVKIDITKEDITSLNDPENFLLQRKVNYEPIIKDTNGDLIKAEIRLLFVWEENAPRPKLVTNLARLSRGKMIGVDFNKNFDWVGGSCAFFEM